MNARVESNIELVTVAICTYRRESVLLAIEAASKQVLDPNWAMEILVVDNDVVPSGREIIEEFCRRKNISVKYIHAPGPNISIARNACLAEAGGRWIAFYDDDGAAAHDWLKTLLNNAAGAQAVFGIAKALYNDEAPAWMRKGDFHSNIFNGPRGGYTSNVLIDLHFVRSNNLKFEEDLGRSGGEDTLLFYQMHLLGGVLRFAADACVYEEVPVERANLRWILKRRVRYGQVHGLVTARYEPRSFKKLYVTAGAKCLFCWVVALTTLPIPSISLKWVARGALHLGAFLYRMNNRIRLEYA